MRFLNVLLILFQLCIVLSFGSMVFLKKELSEVHNNAIVVQEGSSAFIAFLDAFVSAPMLAVVVIAFCWSIFKEFHVKDRGKKIRNNLVLLFVFLCVGALSTYAFLYPIFDMPPLSS